MNPLNTLVKALLTGFGWRLGSEVAVAISNRVANKSSASTSTGDDEDDEDEPGDVQRG